LSHQPENALRQLNPSAMASFAVRRRAWAITQATAAASG
jgi:hypothetical protein